MKLDAGTKALIRLALAEDLGRAGDLTTENFLPQATVRARIVAKESGVFCGAPVAAEVFRLAAPGARVRSLVKEGARVSAGRAVLEVRGPRGVLSAERTVLNFLQRLSGVATLTRRFVDAVRGTRASIYDTRKTTPGWRSLEKYAVRCGGGRNHRMGLYDAVMLKENHLDVLKGRGNVLRERIREFKRRHPRVEVELEARDAAEVRLALACGADAVLLDNMPASRLAPLVREIRRADPRIIIEVSGGVRLEDVRALARLGPDRISVGRLTHSAPALDLSLDILR